MNEKPRYCTIYLVRHGETHANKLAIIQGHSKGKITHLTPKGIIQAKQLARQFKHIKFAAVFSSDLMRAKRTAEIIALGKKLTVSTTAVIRERRFGKFEGLSRTEYLEKMKHQLQKFERLSEAEKTSFKLANDIESVEEITTRSITFLRQIAVAYPKENVLVVCHGGVIRPILIHLGFGTHDELRSGTVTNTAWVKLKSDGVDFFVEETQGVNKQITST